MSVILTNPGLKGAVFAIRPVTMTLDFLVGDRVKIKPCDKIDARVVCVYWDWRGLTYDVRYFENGDAKVARLFPDELELMEA